MRTTVDIDDPILRDLKALQKREGKSLGRLVSDLLALGLSHYASRVAEPAPFRWIARPMQARVDLDDRDAVLDAMDQPTQPAAHKRRR